MRTARNGMRQKACHADISRKINARRPSHLLGSDVLGRCVFCEGPIFNQSKNVHRMNGRRVDGSPKMRHERCPERKAA